LRLLQSLVLECFQELALKPSPLAPLPQAKERLGISDRETVEQIRKNPCLQYFSEMSAYSNEAPFEASTLVHFRQRISIELMKRRSQFD
jgi:hypothetical protein